MNAPVAVALGPLAPTTVTSTAPFVELGVTAVIDVSETTVKELAATEPKSTAWAPVNPVPVIVTAVPPPAGPVVGVTAVIVGTT